MEESTNTPHARAFDLPGWPCPPRVRDVLGHEESWGWIRVSDTPGYRTTLAQDDLGYLWVDGNAVPVFRLPNESDAKPGGVVFWTPDGLGVWVYPKSLQHLGSISRLDMEQDRWIPVAVAAAELPPFVKGAPGE